MMPIRKIDFQYSPYIPSKAVKAFINGDRYVNRKGIYINGRWTLVLYLASCGRRIPNPYVGHPDAVEFCHYWYYHDTDGTSCICSQITNTYDRGYEEIVDIVTINAGEESITLDPEVVEMLDACLLTREEY